MQLCDSMIFYVCSTTEHLLWLASILPHCIIRPIHKYMYRQISVVRRYMGG